MNIPFILIRHFCAPYDKYVLLLLLPMFISIEQARAAPLSEACSCEPSGSLWVINCQASLGSVTKLLEKNTGIHFDIPSDMTSTPVSINVNKATINQILDELLSPFNFTAESAYKNDKYQYARIQFISLKGTYSEEGVSKTTLPAMRQTEAFDHPKLSHLSEKLAPEVMDGGHEKKSSLTNFSNLPNNELVKGNINSSSLNPISESDKIKLDQEFNAMIATQRQEAASSQGNSAPFEVLPTADKNAKPPFAILSNSEKGVMPQWGKADPNIKPAGL